jgi:hypothetical protein
VLATKYKNTSPKSKKQRLVDPRAPKRPVNAYLFFLMDHFEQGAGVIAQASDIGSRWKALSPEEKRVWS